MDFGDITRKAEELLGDDKVKDALKSEQAEGVSDSLLGGVAGVVNNITGNKFTEQIDEARDNVDKRIGDK
ncbi:MAG TPA: Rv0909 family putative TA system antitoxin [Galbitalea sp.]